ncbi:cation/H(+) antiporter 15-like [Punica granatum]|uniref:Uncharacterized protein n=2 Tax=Punica granatum TaxID=22663 RepID=A0A218W2F3_PUNGR|nr:cation/H(+) antiporter 15-like [Punica granatum]OWM66648.1 hypothetical protein CDL15_Pgr010299 [Punica granatum]PKI54658.1 hypothetical protein CRG98_024943 [Punica granatum]
MTKKLMLQLSAGNLMDQHGARSGEDGIELPYTCQLITAINSRGIWYGDDPFAFSVPLLMLQLSLISLFTRSIHHHLLKRLSQPSIVSQILGGVILGPSVLGLNASFVSKVFPAKGRGVFDTFALFGFMLFVFLIGVKIDPFIVLRSGKRTVVIGTLGFFVPYTLTSFVAFLLDHFLSLDRNVSIAIHLIVGMLSMTAFPVVACFLAELKILNSEIGRLSSSSSMICDVCHWSIMTLNYVVRLASTKSSRTSFGSILSMALLIGLIVFGIRPAALWAIRHTPEGKPVKEIYIFSVLVALLLCGFTAEAIGLNAFVASFLLGLVIPDGPPLGATLVERLDCFVTMVLMPLFFTICGLKMNVFSIKSFKNVGVIQLIVLVSFLGKLLGVVMPALLQRMPLRDAFSLGLIMNSKGIIELALLHSWKMSNVMNEECFSIVIISLVVVTGVISPVVRILYDPSRRFIAYKRRTILHKRQNEELRILACIHTEDNVHATMKLLEASNPSKDSPISLCVLHLLNLVGRASSLLIPHFPQDWNNKSSSSQNQNLSERIFNLFRKMEQKHQGQILTLRFYKGISPYATMHNDVCSLALEKRITLIIIPYHRQFTQPWGKVESIHAFRHLNKNVLDKAPCSVGVLIDRSNRKKYYRPNHIEASSYYRVAVLFFGGADDREALAYARRMSEHSHVLLTLIRFSCCGPMEIASGTARSKMLDDEILEDFRCKNNAQRNKERVSYQEEEVRGRGDVMSVFKSMKGCYDLVMVGRRHGESKLMQELRKCSSRDDQLGTIGDILAMEYDNGGESFILVVQQQTRVWGLRDPEESTRLRRIKL